MPYLLQDLWALGSSVDEICDLAGGLDLDPGGAGVLDLGCGKGAVGIRLAKMFGIKVTGVDLMAEFLHEAENRAKDHKVAHLCTFIRQDICAYVKTDHRFDAVILASLGSVIGTIGKTVQTLRTQIRPGGYMFIDHGYLMSADRLDRPGYEDCRNYGETIGLLTSCGDVLLNEIDTTTVSNAVNADYLMKIKTRGGELMRQLPDLKKEISEYIERQEEECRILEREFVSAVWLLQKTGS
jgi:ubiquinone/menaquinone biosynthesis C-methylase UbiE